MMQIYLRYIIMMSLVFYGFWMSWIQAMPTAQGSTATYHHNPLFIGWCPQKTIPEDATPEQANNTNPIFYQYTPTTGQTSLYVLLTRSAPFSSACQSLSLPLDKNQIGWVAPFFPGLLPQETLHSLLVTGSSSLLSTSFQPSSLLPLYASSSIQQPPDHAGKNSYKTRYSRLKEQFTHHVTNPVTHQATVLFNTLTLNQFAREMTATWVWQPDLWLNNPARLLRLAKQHQINRLYCHIPLNVSQEGITVGQETDLAQFIQQANANRIEVWAVLGDPSDILEQGVTKLIARIKALEQYNQRHAVNAQIRGLQLDIEPHLLPGFALQPAHWFQRLLASYQQISGSTPLAIDAVLPFWFADEKTETGQNVVEGILPFVNSITVMDYTTNTTHLVDRFIPFLHILQKAARYTGHHKSVQMAVELSLLPDERRWRFIRETADKPARLHIITLQPASGELTQPKQLVVFTPENCVIPDSMAFRAESLQEEVMPASQISFYQNKTLFWQQLPGIRHQFKRWSVFGGVTYHDIQALAQDERKQSSPNLFKQLSLQDNKPR
jgi:hypothetical protein